MKKWFIFVMAFIMLIGLVSVCNGAGKDKVVVRFGAAPMGGNQYTMGMIFEQVANKSSKDIVISCQSTGGGLQNVNLIGSKEIDIGFSNSPIPMQAYEGVGRFKDNKIENIRVISFIYPGYVQYTCRDMSVNSLRDLLGKKISIGPVGSVNGVYFYQSCKAYGLDPNDFKIEHLSHKDGADALKDGLIDAFLFTTNAPASQIMEVLTTHKGKVFGIDKDVAAKYSQLFPDSYTAEIPANTYPGQDQPITTQVQPCLLLADKDVSDDVIYEVTKTLYENAEQMGKQHYYYKSVNLENSLLGAGTVPVHPGALRYYREQGSIK